MSSSDGISVPFISSFSSNLKVTIQDKLLLVSSSINLFMINFRVSKEYRQGSYLSAEDRGSENSLRYPGRSGGGGH